jgi:two-component system, NtrC family, sensor kinase
VAEDLLSLAQEEWRAVEKLNEVLFDAADLPQALKTGLDIVLATLNRSGAALFLPRFCEHVSQDWTAVDPPPAWQARLNDNQARIHLLADQAFNTGLPVPGSDSLELGAVFPIYASKKVVGVLLVGSPVVPPADYPRWQALLRPFGRMVAVHTAASGSSNGAPSYRELMGSRNTLRAMFDSLPISIYIIDNSYNLVAINLSRSERVGGKPAELVGARCFEKLYLRSTSCPGCRVGETFAAAENTVRISRSWLDNEKFIEWEIGTFPIFDERNIVTQAILIEQDVTEKRNLESNLIQSEKLAAVGQLAAGVAHEINNPLTAIIANAQILRREVSPEDEDVLESVKLIEMAGTRASQVIRNLLGIARKEKYEFEPIDLNNTLLNAIALVQHELIGRPVKVELQLAEKLPPLVASQDQLQGVWINLILNAIDAVDKESGQISISSAYTGSEYQVTISDNGKGIPADHLPRVFEPFFTTKSPGRGTGLGLSVCMRVIRHHGGNIQVESQLGKWTRFTVSLPGAQQDLSNR